MSDSDSHSHGLRGKLDHFLKEGLAQGEQVAIKEQANFKHSLGLGHKPNVVPPGEAIVTGEPRTVELGWHPVGGMGGKWFAEQTWFGHEITKEVGKYPDPTQHWAVLVGEFVHELWMDEQFNIIYINEVIKRDEWHTFEVGQTRFNDEALRQAGEMVIHNMRKKRAAYNLISNNCQNFADNLLDAIQIGSHQQFATAFAVYQRASGHGDIKDLFSANSEAHPDEGTSHSAATPHKQSAAQYAQELMEKHTSKLEFHPDSILKAFHH